MELRPPTSEFRELAARLAADDESVSLAEAALRVAAEFQPGVALAPVRAELARLGAAAARTVPANGALAARAASLLDYLRGCGFRGNEVQYDDPRNSFLPAVLSRRTGIPITLSILYMEVGRRVGLPIEGISFPGHFLVRLRLRGGTLVLDPFTGGAPLSEAELRERLKRVIPHGVADDVPVGELPMDQFLEPATNRQILSRLLRNLKGIYLDRRDPARALAAADRIVELTPRAAEEYRDRAAIYLDLECFRAALSDFRTYLMLKPGAEDSAVVQRRVVELQQIAARLN
jgi:regulator of sirC expression with transglutaminase-like and TPR domain